MEGNAADEGLSLGLANFRTGSKGGLRHVWYNEALSQRERGGIATLTRPNSKRLGNKVRCWVDDWLLRLFCQRNKVKNEVDFTNN